MEDGVRGPPEPIMKIETRTAASLREALSEIPRSQRDANQGFSIRVWRAISWLGRAEYTVRATPKADSYQLGSDSMLSMDAWMTKENRGVTGNPGEHSSPRFGVWIMTVAFDAYSASVKIRYSN